MEHDHMVETLAPNAKEIVIVEHGEEHSLSASKEAGSNGSGDPTGMLAVGADALSDRPGDWRVLIVGSRADDGWEMKILGPNGFERSYRRAPAFGDRERASEAAAREDAAGVKEVLPSLSVKGRSANRKKVQETLRHWNTIAA